MKTVNGKYASAIVFTDNVEDYALAQIQMICDNESAAGSRVRIMPDVHPGKIGPIGLTMSVTDAVLPGLVGIDIGCGVSVVKLKARRLEYQKLDANIIPEEIPELLSYMEKVMPHREEAEDDDISKIEIDVSRFLQENKSAGCEKDSV